MLLDASFLIDLIRKDPAAVARAKSMEREAVEVLIPTPVLFELWRGVHLASKSAQEEQRVTRLLATYPTAPFDAEAASRAGELDARLVKEGSPIDPEDAMIEGIALARDAAILTKNVKHFGRVPGLRVEEY